MQIPLSKGDPNNLVGLLLVISEDAVKGRHYFGLVSHDMGKISSALKKVPEGLEQVVIDGAAEMARMQAAFEKEGQSIGLLVAYRVDGHVTDYILVDDIDEYNTPSVSSFREFNNYVLNMASQYLSAYAEQQARKQGSTTANIYDLPQKYRLRALLNLSKQLLKAVDKNDPIAQIRLEDMLYAFVPNPTLHYHVKEITNIASLPSKERGKLALIQCAIIDAIIQEDYSLAGSLNRVYTNIFLNQNK